MARGGGGGTLALSVLRALLVSKKKKKKIRSAADDSSCRHEPTTARLFFAPPLPFSRVPIEIYLSNYPPFQATLVTLAFVGSSLSLTDNAVLREDTVLCDNVSSLYLLTAKLIGKYAMPSIIFDTNSIYESRYTFSDANKNIAYLL